MLTQWITLFDDVEDDTYDGTLGEDDSDKPRVLLTFETVSAPQALKQISQSMEVEKPRTFMDSDDEVQIQSVVPVPT